MLKRPLARWLPLGRVNLVLFSVVLLLGWRYLDKRRPIAPSIGVSPVADSQWAFALGNTTPKTVGRESGKAIIVVMFDYECAYCMLLSRRLDSLSTGYHDVDVVFLHLPAPDHPVASIAARGAVCADKEGNFITFHRYLLASNSWRRLPDWEAIAHDAGIQDTASFVHCLTDSSTTRQLRASLDAAIALGVTKTPTLVTKHLRFEGIPSVKVFGALADDARRRER